MRSDSEYERRVRAVRLLQDGVRFGKVLYEVQRGRFWLSKWSHRYEDFGLAGLHDRSRTPQHIRNKTRGADPETKGKVENLVKFVKGNFLASRDFEIVEEANGGVLKWLPRRANGKICQATKQIPAVLLEEERAHLRRLRNSIFRKDSLLGREDRTANDKALISVQASNYQLPSMYRNKIVEIYTTAEALFVFDVVTGKEIISYRLSLIPGQVISTRSSRKEGETTVEVLKAAVVGLFELEPWKRFVERNFKTFPRYARDQCLEAKRFFAEKEIDLGILERALAYCLENDTPSFTNLKDTHVHFERESRQPNRSPSSRPKASAPINP